MKNWPISNTNVDTCIEKPDGAVIHWKTKEDTSRVIFYVSFILNMSRVYNITCALSKDSCQPSINAVWSEPSPSTYRCFGSLTYITKTYLYNFERLKTHFYIVKLGFTGVYIIFLIPLKT